MNQEIIFFVEFDNGEVVKKCVSREALGDRAPITYLLTEVYPSLPYPIRCVYAGQKM